MEKQQCALFLSICFALSVLVYCADDYSWLENTNTSLLYKCYKSTACDCDNPDALTECLRMLSKSTRDYFMVYGPPECELNGTVQNFYCVKKKPEDCLETNIRLIYQSVYLFDYTVDGFLAYLDCLKPIVQNCEENNYQCEK